MSVLTGQALRNYIVRQAKARGLDPKAVLAIVSVEGGFYGAVGDGGTSFGPFQLHQGGALPGGMSGAKARAWANSAAGINYALGAIAGVAQGLKGYEAVHAIAYSFERPADPAKEVTRAWAAYGGGPIPAGAPATSTTTTSSADQSVFTSTPDVASLATAEQSQPAILSPGAVPAASSGPQQMAQTWQLLASQPLADQETQALYRRVQLAGGSQ